MSKSAKNAQERLNHDSAMAQPWLRSPSGRRGGGGVQAGGGATAGLRRGDSEAKARRRRGGCSLVSGPIPEKEIVNILLNDKRNVFLDVARLGTVFGAKAGQRRGDGEATARRRRGHVHCLVQPSLSLRLAVTPP